MPSRDWMCRAEVVLPEIRQLLNDPQFDVYFATLPQYLEPRRTQAPVRKYTLDDVFHGMSIGKNGDLFRRLSRRAESSALAAESLSALLGLFGRPYASWDVYPTWELDEAWRELLSAQHHDNEECEGLCGYVGRYSYERSLQLTEGIVERGLRRLAQRVDGSAGDLVVYNPLGWERTDVAHDPLTGSEVVAADVPGFGYRTVARITAAHSPPPTVLEDGATVRLRRGALEVAVDLESGAITELASAEFPAGILDPDRPLATFHMVCGGEVETFAGVEVHVDRAKSAPSVLVRRRARDGSVLCVRISLAPVIDAVDLHVTSDAVPRSDSRMAAALQMPITFRLPGVQLIHDHPFGISEIRAEGTYRRKYPTGDWMTSPQVYEEIYNPFTALSFVDFVAGKLGVLYIHDGSQGMLRDGSVVRNLLSMHDAWDEDYFVAGLDARMRILPHGALTHSDRWRRAQEFSRPLLAAVKPNDSGDMPATFAGVWGLSAGAAATAFYREAEDAGRHCIDYAGAGMHLPYILRLVELNGDAAEASLHLPGRVATARRANLCGERIADLPIVEAHRRLAGEPGRYRVPINLRPRAIATVYLDLEMGRKVYRDLDSRRHVWAGGESYERRLEP
jgi:alpha-mannosidase